MKNLQAFLRCNSGATAIEYGLIAAAMATCLIAAMPFISSAIKGKFTTIGTRITSS